MKNYILLFYEPYQKRSLNKIEFDIYLHLKLPFHLEKHLFHKHPAMIDLNIAIQYICFIFPLPIKTAWISLYTLVFFFVIFCFFLFVFVYFFLIRFGILHKRTIYRHLFVIFSLCSCRRLLHVYPFRHMYEYVSYNLYANLSACVCVCVWYVCVYIFAIYFYT